MSSPTPPASTLGTSTPPASTPPVTPISPIAPPPPAPTPQRRAEPDAKTGGPFVKYVGEASQRLIKPHQWVATVGQHPDSTDEKPVTFESSSWDKTNSKIIPVSKFTNKQLDYLLLDDLQAPPKGGHSFLEVDYDKDGKLVQVHLLKEDADS